jgi:hypothetical protein
MYGSTLPVRMQLTCCRGLRTASAPLSAVSVVSITQTLCNLSRPWRFINSHCMRIGQAITCSA